MANSHTNVWLKTTPLYYIMYLEVRNPNGPHRANVRRPTAAFFSKEGSVVVLFCFLFYFYLLQPLETAFILWLMALFYPEH